jgi:hypothetical protein
MNLSRRDFLKGLLGGAAAIAIGAVIPKALLAAPEPPVVKIISQRYIVMQYALSDTILRDDVDNDLYEILHRWTPERLWFEIAA